MSAIEARETQIKLIYELSDQMKGDTADKDGLVQQLAAELLKLRHESIKVVELVVLWRDQIRYLTMMGTRQKHLRKRRAQTAIQIPYLTADNVNYLL